MGKALLAAGVGLVALALGSCGTGDDHQRLVADAGRDAAAVPHDAAVAHDAAADATVAALDASVDATVAPEHDAGLGCGLGTMYPDRDVIDPDDPNYSDEFWTADEVDSAFAQARAQDSDAYRAYRAARELPHLVSCAFCPCGCGPAIGHRSGVDCFKDMHGFS